MRPTKLLGALFLLAGLFTVTRGQGWQFGYIVAGLALAFVGLLLTARLQTRHLPAAPVVRRARPLNLAQKSAHALEPTIQPRPQKRLLPVT